ncbi:uncharacterized protein ANIA_11493 [Aspergillus nidulans FGSC A4]|uniref:Uncharacterized protein n=1 Tax=Emericella nidulans (strain FGSC A4 / ATCC 38163 / CBS 112.46 / NRRL 194 / M139) TaxID=227321 RepID=C8UZV9_EMENI|nr:hypothetical protein [Aspergillus nidulans FGSC A4]CBF70622.1 TPA: hypothetical protein ANIA_11493 [Aspergillus nidulans FGSC A4]
MALCGSWKRTSNIVSRVNPRGIKVAGQTLCSMVCPRLKIWHFGSLDYFTTAVEV